MKSDTDLEADVEAELLWDPRIDADGLLVSVRGGVVSLGGHVASYAEKWAAESATKKVAGVAALVDELKGINNAILVQPQVDAGDVWSQICQAFQRHARLDSDRITVSVREGHVTLTGSVRSWCERDDAEKAAWAAPGVKEVKNDLAVTA